MFSYKLVAVTILFFLLPINFFGQETFDYSNSLSIKEITDKVSKRNLIPKNDQEVSVVGQVHLPGLYKLKRYNNLLHALALAGGGKVSAGADFRVIRRNENGVYEKEVFVDFEDTFLGKVNFKLKSGDIIVVPKRKPQLPISVPVKKTKIKPIQRDFIFPSIPPNHV